MRAGLLSLVVVTGCSFAPRAEHAGPVDAAPPDAPCAFSTLFDTCALTAGGASALLLTGDNTYDTTAGALYDANGTPIAITRQRVTLASGDVEVLVASDVELQPGATLRATGSYPLAIVATGTIALDMGAAIDVGRGGAGARTSCPNGAGPGAVQSGGGGGGGGGGLGAAGGRGGNGNSDGTAGQGGAGGEALAVAPAGLLGGCAGASGGSGSDPGTAGGAGGGAIYLGARASITLAASAVIDAGGAGGGGATAHDGDGDAGGGGGGSGGLIVLESASVQSDGVVAANGGAGGAGSGGGVAGGAGAAGQRSIDRATGGTDGGSTGTTGGDGGALSTATGDDVTGADPGGGGGGGGGVGILTVRAPYMRLAVASPAAG